MNEEQRIKLLEEELKILKNEVKTILLDIREQYLNIQNPFNFSMVPNTGTPPAGPDKDKEEVPPDIFDLGKNSNQPSADAGLDDPDLSFGKPFADLDANKPGPGGPTDDMPELGPSSGSEALADSQPGPSAGSPQEDEKEAEDEPAPKPKKGKKKNIIPVELESEAEIDEAVDEEKEEPLSGKGSPRNGKKKGGTATMAGSRADLVVIAGMTQWIDQACGKLGKDRTEALVEMSSAMGRIPTNIKDVLIRMIHISRYESTSKQSPTATDYLATLAQLESLMGGSEEHDSALLSMLSVMKESRRG
jgi:archaellum component FlaD/FlaE